MAVTNVSTIHKIKESFRMQLDKKYGSKITDLRTKISAIQKKQNRELANEIESSVLESFTSLKKTHRCDYKHTSSDETTITLVFRVDTTSPEVDKLVKECEDYITKLNKKKDELDEWEVSALVANLQKDGIPEFKIGD